MKVSFRIYITSVICALAVLAGGPFAFADKGKIIKSGRKALTGKTEVSNISSKTSSAARKGVSGVAVERALETATAAQRGAVSTSAVRMKGNSETAAGQKTPSARLAETPEFSIPNLGEFLTGPQALQTFRPGWHSELMLAGFTEAELAAIEETFEETDALLFELDEAGNWLSPLGNDWEYSKWFSQLLAEKVALNEGQVKTLFGKFSRLDDVFTRLNLQAFWLVNKRAPKSNAPGEEGKLARHVKYNLDKRDDRKMNPEVEGYVYGDREVVVAQSAPARLSTPTPSYGPKGRAPNRTPDEVLEQVLQFIRDNGRFPSKHAEDEAECSLRLVFDYNCKKAEAQNLKDGTSQRLLALKEQWVNKIKTPEEVLKQTLQFIKKYDCFPSGKAENEAERLLRKAFDYNCSKAETANLTDEVSLQLLSLKAEWVNKIAVPRTPDEVLEQVLQFIRDNDRFPLQSAEDEAERSLRRVFDVACKKIKEQNLTDEISLKLLAIKSKWVQVQKEPVARRTPDEVLDQVLQFIKEHNCFPSQYAEDEAERSLRKAFDKACKKAEAQNLTDQTSLKLLALKEKWVNKIAVPRTPDEVLEQVLQFIKEYDRFPSYTAEDETERSLRKAFGKACKKAEAQNLTDQTSLKLLALKEKWVNKIEVPRTPEEILEQALQFIKEHDRMPSLRAEDKAERSLRKAFDDTCKKVEAQNLTDETSLKLLALKKQWVRPRT